MFKNKIMRIFTAKAGANHAHNISKPNPHCDEKMNHYFASAFSQN